MSREFERRVIHTNRYSTIIIHRNRKEINVPYYYKNIFRKRFAGHYIMISQFTIALCVDC